MKNATAKKDTVRLLCILLIVVLIPFILITAAVRAKEEVAIKPHIFYHGSLYSWDKKSGESSLKELADTLIQDGTIDTLLEMTEVCDDDFQTNEESYLNAGIYWLKSGDEHIIYLQLSPFSDVLLPFKQDR